MKYFFYALAGTVVIALLSNSAFSQEAPGFNERGVYYACSSWSSGLWTSISSVGTGLCFGASCERCVDNTGWGGHIRYSTDSSCTSYINWSSICYDSDYCPEGQSFNPATQECESPPVPCEGEVNPYTGECETCDSNNYNTLDLTPLDPGYGECLGYCEPGGMRVYNHSMQEGSHCVATPSECNPSYGSSFEAATGGTFNYCDQLKQECDSIGGIYGAVGANGETRHICITNMDPPPTCSSGSQYWVENADGSSGFACITTNPPPETCDGSLYDCDDDGKVDDQDGDGCIDNGVENDPACSGTGTGAGAGGPGKEPGKEVPDPNNPNVGSDPLDPPTTGDGDCDPTATNYAECMGQMSNVGDSYLDQLISGASDLASGVTDGFGESVIDSIGDGESGLVGSDGVGDSIVDIFNAGSCSDIGFNFKGHDFTITCSGTARLRSLLAWLFAAYTFITVFHILTNVRVK